MNSRLRRQRQKADQRRRILHEAAAMIVREGFENLSLRRLAARLGYTAGALYHYFKSKEEILDCLVESSFAELQAVLDRLPRDGTGDPVAMLKRGLRTYVEFGLRSPHHYRFAFVQLPAHPRRKWKPHPPFDVLRGMVRRCHASGRLRVADPELVSQGLWTTVHGITSLLIARPRFPWVDRDRLIDHVIESAVAGVMTGEGRRS